MDVSAIEAFAESITTPRIFLACAAAYFLAFGPRIPRIFGRAQTKYFHSRNPLQLPLKDGTKTTLDRLCKSVIPPCNLNPFIFNGHLQTIWTAVATNSIDIYYRRWIFEQENPSFEGTFAIDFMTKPYTKTVDNDLPPRTTYFTPEEFETMGSDDTRPMLVVLHGLTGGSHELYLREVLGKLCLGNSDWEACVVNSRGCAHTKLTSTILYNARATWDMRQAVKFLKQQFPNRPLFGCGFSLGANIMTNYIGEEGDKCELRAAVVLSSPWNLEMGNRALQRTWMGLNVYSRAMGTSLKHLFERHVDELSKNPDLDIEAIRNLNFLHEFDYLYQGPTWGYPTASAYYRDAASTDSLLNIYIPFLSINAEDDPIASFESLPYEEMKETPYGILCTTELGGHLSWFQLGGGRWFADAAANFLRKMASDVDLDSIPKPPIMTNGLANGHIERKPLKPMFAPIRRKWHIPRD